MADAKPAPEGAGERSAETPKESAAKEFPDRTWESHRRRQATNGLKLTPAERLRWLEDTMEEMRRWVGRAKHGRPIGRD